LNCNEAEERLPWLLGGGLPADEVGAVREHVAACAACRQALDQTRKAADVFDAHLPASVLTDLAWDGPGAPLPPELARRHLESCAECAEELELVRQSRALEGATGLVRPALPVRARPRFAHWAAPLAAGLVIGLGWGALREARPTAGPPSPEPRMPAELQRLRDENTALQAQLGEARAPQVNLPVLELFPADAARRSAEPREDEVVIPGGARLVAVLLGAEAAADRPASIELRDQGGRIVWSGSGLKPGAQGAYAVAIPVSLMPDGRYTVVVQPQGARAIRYALRVRHSTR